MLYIWLGLQTVQLYYRILQNTNSPSQVTRRNTLSSSDRSLPRVFSDSPKNSTTLTTTTERPTPIPRCSSCTTRSQGSDVNTVKSLGRRHLEETTTRMAKRNNVSGRWQGEWGYSRRLWSAKSAAHYLQTERYSLGSLNTLWYSSRDSTWEVTGWLHMKGWRVENSESRS